MSVVPQISAFDLLADIERRSLAHAAGMPEQIQAPGLWRGIGFRVGDRFLASTIADVNEILSVPPLTQVPGTRHWVLGVANVRGVLAPVIDLKTFLGGSRTITTDSSRVLLVRQQAGSVGLLVDEVLGQRNFVNTQKLENAELDENYARFVYESYVLGDVQWSLFSMAELARAPDFLAA
jgi:twitching motility protein PilI